MSIGADILQELAEIVMRGALPCDQCGEHPDDGHLYPVGPSDKIELLCADCYMKTMQGKYPCVEPTVIVGG